MTLIQLKYFQTICKYNNITRASAELHVSQPSLSNAVKELEREFGVSLFTRRSRGLELTQEGGIVNFFCPEEDFIFFWIRYFDLDCDYSEYINKINPRDKYLMTAGELGSGIRILQQDLWEITISFLISQQNNITRIKKCIENISREFGVRKISSTGAEYYAFPSADALASTTEEQLRGCNL